MRSLCLTVLIFASSWAAAAADLYVFAAASLTDALQEIARSYPEKSDKVFFNFAASSILARQIQEGAPADIFFSADPEKMENLEKLKLIRPGTRTNLLSNSLVIIARSDDANLKISAPADLIRLTRIALAETTTVPAGIYARRYLESAGVWEKIKPRVIPTENVRGTLAAVEAGNVDAGIVYKTDAAMSRKVRILFDIPTTDAPPIRYPVALLQHSRSPEPALKFFTFLQSETAKAIFQKHGFIVLPKNG